MGGQILGYNSCPCSIFLDLRMQIGWRSFRNPRVEDDWTLECPEICAHIVAVMMREWAYKCHLDVAWIGWWAYRCHLDVDRIGDSLARTCIPVKETNEYLTRCRSWFYMLGIDMSWLVTGAGSGASNADEWTSDGYYLSMNGKRTFGDFNFNNACWEKSWVSLTGIRIREILGSIWLNQEKAFD